jgi:hypothetical protein
VRRFARFTPRERDVAFARYINFSNPHVRARVRSVCVLRSRI